MTAARWLVVAACAAPVAAACDRPADPPAAAAPRPLAQDPDMLHAIDDAAARLLTAPTAAAAAAQLGAAVPTPDGSAALFVRPSDKRLTAARIAALPDGAVHTVALTLATPVTVAELRDRFGDYKVTSRSDPDQPWHLIFRAAIRGVTTDLSILVEASGPLDQLPAQPIATVTLRADARD